LFAQNFAYGAHFTYAASEAIFVSNAAIGAQLGGATEALNGWWRLLNKFKYMRANDANNGRTRPKLSQIVG
jgi:hypothetical protein